MAILDNKEINDIIRQALEEALISEEQTRIKKLKDTPLWDKLEGADGKKCSELSEETRRRPKRNQQKIKSTGEKIKKATR